MQSIRVLIPLLILSVFVFDSGNLFSRNVDEDEIRNSKRIRFINYSGPAKKNDSEDDVRKIGAGLSEGSKRGGYDKPFRILMKYSVVRVDTVKDKSLLAADVISIDKDARVAHIINVRRIISAYLAGQYGYSTAEADAVALYVTYYNAMHRRDKAYFEKKYVPQLQKLITNKNAGLSTKYFEWPGASKIIIPVKEGERSKKIDPFEISNDDTNKKIKKDDKNKKELLELKKKDVDEDKNILKKKKDELEKKEKELEKEKKRIEEKKKETEDKKKKTEDKEKVIKKEKENAEKIKDPEEKKKKIDEIKKEEKKVEEEKKKIVKEEEKTKRDEKTIEKKEQETEKGKEEVKKKETELTEKEKKIEKESGEVKKDPAKKEDLVKKEEKLKEKEKELDKREDKLRDKEADKNIFGIKLYYLKIKEYLANGHYNNEMYMINATTRKVEFMSPVGNICGSRYDVFSEGVVVITHIDGHGSGHRLTMLDRETLKAKGQGTDNIFWRSFIEIRDGFIYAVIEEKGSYYLGRFDKDLKLSARSKEKISENTFISFFGDNIYINRHDKTIIVLKKEDLTFVDEIKP